MLSNQIINVSVLRAVEIGLLRYITWVNAKGYSWLLQYTSAGPYYSYVTLSACGVHVEDELRCFLL